MSVPQAARDLMSHGRVMALATSTRSGEPNVAPMGQCWWYSDNEMVIGDFFMKVTKINIQENGTVAFTAWDDVSRVGYKFKGEAEYKTSGPEYEFATGEMKKKKPDKDFKGVVVIHVKEVYDMKPGPTAGQLITE